jgi:hypothetical protein
MANDDQERFGNEGEPPRELEVDEDEQLLAELRQLGRMLDPVPAQVIFAARGSLAWRRVDAELAELSFDSLVDGDLELAGVRSGDDSVRMVSFDGADLTVEVEVEGLGDRRRLVGQLVPPQVASIELRSASEGRSSGLGTRADSLGRFSLDLVVAGPTSLRCSLESGRTIETGWVVI